jgi:hypothetical protein
MKAKKKKAKKKPTRAKAKTRKTAAKKRAAKRLDSLLDSELEDTFPASDPVELTEPGLRSRRRRRKA